MKGESAQTIRYLRERAGFYGKRAKQRRGTLADRDRAIARAYRDDARALEAPRDGEAKAE